MIFVHFMYIVGACTHRVSVLELYPPSVAIVGYGMYTGANKAF
jgi:hypothetical protein